MARALARRAQLWAWLRDEGVHAPAARTFDADADAGTSVAEFVRDVGGPPCVIRCYDTDQDDDDEGTAFLVEKHADEGTLAAHVRQAQTVLGPGGLVVLRDDRANGRIGLMLHDLPPLILTVEAGPDFATALSAHLLLSGPAEKSEDGGDRHTRRTRSLAELDWQLGKIYKSVVSGAAGRFADDESWAKVRWGARDAERVLQRAELAAWMVHNRSVPSYPPSTPLQYAVHVELHFSAGCEVLPGQPVRASDLEELIVVDVQPIGGSVGAHNLARPSLHGTSGATRLELTHG